MSNVAKLKKKAAELEQKKQFDKALVVYSEILQLIDGKEEEGDVALYNRVGDLLIRQGDVAQAVDCYERAVDLYAEGGFFNNAIALCNKILRNSPGRTSIYYKLGKISAKKGFVSDAKQNFLEYADRMQKAGRMDEAFRALKEFADLCPDQDDIRLMLAEQLSKKSRKGEALEQLQMLYEKFESEGRATEARATIDRMKAIDANAVPKRGGGPAMPKSGDLVFLDLDEPSSTPARPSLAQQPPVEPRRSASMRQIEPIPDQPADPGTLPGLTSSADFGSVDSLGSGGTGMSADSLLGLEHTSMDDAGASAGSSGSGLLDIEPTSLGDVSGASAESLGVEFSLDGPGDIELSLGEERDTAPERPRHDLALPGELPMLDMPGTDDTEEGSGGTLDFIMPEESEPMTLSTPTGVNSYASDAPLLDMEPDFGVPEQAAPPPRISSSVLASSVEALQDRAAQDSSNWALRRQLGEALLERGDREEGFQELEMALIGYERSGDLDSASSVADEIIRLNPNSVRHHQKRVEYAFRTNDRARLIDAYLELADSLFRSGQPDKARAVYQRVLELSPDDIRAQAALSAFIEPAAAPAPPKPKPQGGTPSGIMRRYTAQVPVEPPPPAAAPIGADDDDFVNLGDLLRDDDGPRSTRMVVEEQEPTGDEAADFADMLRRFKQGVAENVEEEDHQSHYDLGVAYKEMGLLDEAIAEFQKALRGVEGRVRTYEALGQCFLEKGQFSVAQTVLLRALGEPGHIDEQLVGVLYLLGYASEALQQWGEALGFYQRVFAVDIAFRDVGERIAALEQVFQ